MHESWEWSRRAAPGARRSVRALAQLLSISVALAARADVRLPRLISDNMILERSVPVTLWGWAEPGERVQVGFRGALRSTHADASGCWSVVLPPFTAGGPSDLTIRGRNALRIRNVLVGEVWVASGQSNMEFPVARQGGFGGVASAERDLATANLPRIRLLALKRDTALTAAADIGTSGWKPATPESVAKFSAVGYLFARALHKSLGVPIGIIQSAWGGTPAESWVSTRGLARFPEFAAAIEREARVDPVEIATYDRYLAERNAWYALHGHDDRGRIDGVNVFAQRELDDRGWTERVEPQPWPVKDAKGFDGTVWFRHTVTIGAAQAEMPVRVHLGAMLQSDATYFNGVEIGATDSERVERNYAVPPDAVHPGENVLAVRLAGDYASGDGYVGMLGDPDDYYLATGGHRTPLAGPWRYAPGADLGALASPPLLGEFRTQFPQAPALLFNAMVAPLARFRVKGVLWYQGESNVGRARQYRSLFPALIDDWRRAWGEELPFLFVQLAGHGSNAGAPNSSPWAELREAQVAALGRPRTGMATAVDIGDALDIHPVNKADVAHRLALAAERIAYGRAVVDRGPTFAGMVIEGRRIRVRFRDAASGLHTRGEPTVRGFAIAGFKGRFEAAEAVIEGNDILVWSQAVEAPAAVRYDWANTPDGNLYGAADLPALPFRSDATD